MTKEKGNGAARDESEGRQDRNQGSRTWMAPGGESWLKGTNVLSRTCRQMVLVDLLVRPKWLPRGSEEE
jgi:hypothetical protein